jgi:uncharacterized protein involved in type VI secretion and phage assembly
MGLAAKIRLEIDGNEVKDFVDLKIQQTIYRPNEFELRCRLTTFEQEGTFPMEKSKDFIGKTLKAEIEKYTGNYKNAEPAFFFKGLITNVTATTSGLSNNDHIILSGYSPDILLQGNPGCNSFDDKTIKQVAEKILNLQAKDVLRTKVNPANIENYDYTVQYQESNYDFLRRLAVRAGEWFFYDGSTLIFGQPSGKTVDLLLGLDLSDFAFSIQVKPMNMRFTTFDAKKGKPAESKIVPTIGKDQLNSYAITAHRESNSLFNYQVSQINIGNTSYDKDYGKELNKVAELKGNGAAVNMSVVTGKSQNPELQLGGKINVKTVATKDSGAVDYGEYQVTAITHYCDNLRNYSNEFACIPGKAKVPDYTDPLVHPHCEPQNALVVDNKDPEQLGRVKVKFFWQPEGYKSPWLRVMNAHSGNESGMYFIPEVDSEVMVGFESGDAEKPYIMGSLHHGNQKPAKTWVTKDNDIKAIRTRSGNTIELIDKQGKEEIIIYQEKDKSAAHHISLLAGNDPVLNIFSKGKLIIEAKSIEIKTSQGSIEIKSNKDLLVKGLSKVNVEGANVNASADAQMKVSGMNVDVKADAQLKNSGAMVSVEGSGVTEIKGGIVKIN